MLLGHLLDLRLGLRIKFAEGLLPEANACGQLLVIVLKTTRAWWSDRWPGSHSDPLGLTGNTVGIWSLPTHVIQNMLTALLI